MAAISEISLHGVRAGGLLPDSRFPLLLEPDSTIGDPIEWARQVRTQLADLILKHGAILFRGFAVPDAARFEAFADALCPSEWVQYREAATPRSNVAGNVFTSTEHPAEFHIYVHNENSHVTSWPLYLFFHCERPAAEGGRTPIADCRAVRDQIPRVLFERFAREGWQYRRNFAPGSTFTWQNAFGVSSVADLLSYCRRNFMLPEWNRDVLTVRYRRWALVRHPRTNEEVWFNHGTFFNVHTIEPGLRDAVLRMGEERIPYNTYYGDGSPISEQAIQALDTAYRAATVSFDWRAGDVLMLDNMLTAHGRTPYRGERQIRVVMKQNVQCSEVASAAQYALPRQ